MTSEAIVLWTETSSDPELIAGVRAGDSAAFGVLYERHVGAARKVAAQYTNSMSDVDDVVSESFSRVLRALQRGDGPDLAFRAYLFTIVRRTGLDIINKGIRTKPREDMSPYESTIGYEPASDEPALDNFEHAVVADAFKSLPERWQAVLWYTEVENKAPKDIAPLLGLSANGVAALAYRAREALRQAYLQQHLGASQSDACVAANAQLGAYVRGGLSKRENTQVDVHVQVCERCTAVVGELKDVNHGMRAVIAPLFMGLLGVGALEGGLPIGGAIGGQGIGASAGGAGASSSGGAGAGVGGVSGLGGVGAAGVAGVAGFAGATGTATKSAAATGLTGLLGASSPVVLPTAAVIGLAALVMGGASLLGWFPMRGDSTRADSVEVGESVEVAPPSNDTDNAPTVQDPSDSISATDDAPGQETGQQDDDEAFLDGSSAGSGDRANLSDAPADGAAAAPAGHTPAAPASGPAPLTPETRPGGVTHAPTQPTSPGAPGAPGTSDPTTPSVITPPGDGGGEVGGEGSDGNGGTESPGVPGGPGAPQPQPQPSPDAQSWVLAAFTIAKAPLDYLEISRVAPQVSMTVENTGSAPAQDVTAQITLPQGLEVAAPRTGGAGMGAVSADRLAAHLDFAAWGTFDAGEWTCDTNSDMDVVTCVLDFLDTGHSTTLTLPVRIVNEQLPAGSQTTFAVTAGTVAESYSVETAVASRQGDGNPLDPTYANTGGEAVAHFGGTVMGCHANPVAWTSCYLAMTNLDTKAGQNLSNNDWTMVEIKPDSAGPNVGVTKVDLPADAKVKAAYLEWSANRFVDPDDPDNNAVSDGWTSDLETVQLKQGTGQFVTITADKVDTSTVEESRQYYLARANVTDLLSDLSSTTITVADVAVASSRLEKAVHTYYGGFTLTVVYEDPDVHQDTRVALFEGPHWVKSSSPVTISFRAEAGERVTPSWTAYEGDRGNAGDRISLGSDAFVPLAVLADGTVTQRDPNDAADSWANGSTWTNTMGIDAKGFDGKLVSDSRTHSVVVSTNGDNFMIGMLAITVTPPAASG